MATHCVLGEYNCGKENWFPTVNECSNTLRQMALDEERSKELSC